MSIKIKPHILAEVLDATNIVRRIPLIIQGWFDLPIPPSTIMLLRRQNHRGIGREPRKITVAPVCGDESCHPGMINLESQQKARIIVARDHHK